MPTLSLVESWHPDDLAGREYDCFLTAVGFETRARYFAENYNVKSNQRLAVAFQDRQVLSFDENRRFFADAGFEVQYPNDDGYVDWARDTFWSLTEKCDAVSVCVDISSLSRFRLAAILLSARELAARVPITVDFLYCQAGFSTPQKIVVPNLKVGPVIPAFAGWSVEPDLPTSVVVGLGYEYDKAIGAVEYVDPAEVWVYRPTGHDEKYTRAIDKANIGFLDSLPERCKLSYEVLRPMDCFLSLESLASGAVQTRKLILMPFGPKIFALSCMLVASLYPNDVAVWRVSSGYLEEPSDRKASGNVTGLRASFGLPRPALPDIEIASIAEIVIEEIERAQLTELRSFPNANELWEAVDFASARMEWSGDSLPNVLIAVAVIASPLTKVLPLSRSGEDCLANICIRTIRLAGFDVNLPRGARRELFLAADRELNEEYSEREQVRRIIERHVLPGSQGVKDRDRKSTNKATPAVPKK